MWAVHKEPITDQIAKTKKLAIRSFIKDVKKQDYQIFNPNYGSVHISIPPYIPLYRILGHRLD